MIRRAILTCLMPFVLLAAVGCGEDSTPHNPWDFAQGCGDNAAGEGEACDGTDLRGRDCQSFGYGGGELRCNEACTGFLVGECTGVPEWSPADRSACFDCADDEVCINGRCETVCSGEPIAGESLTYDVRTHVVQGRVTLAGEALSGDEPMAELTFFNQADPRELRASVDVLADRDGRYRMELHPGTYDVFLTAAEGFTPVAYGPGVLIASDVRIDGERTLDFDLPSPVSLDVSIEASQRMRELGLPGAVDVERLVETPIGERFVKVASSANYAEAISVTTLPGTYRVRFSYHGEGELPSNSRALLWGPTRVDADTELTLPLSAYELSGRVSFRDDLPSSLPIYVEIRRRGSDEPLVEFWPDDGQFSQTLVAADYQVRAYVAGLEEDLGHVAFKDVSLDRDEQVGLTLGDGLVAVGGRVEPVPTQEVPPSLWFTRREEPYLLHTVRVVDGSFETVLPPGTYDLGVDQYEGSTGSYMPLSFFDEVEVGDVPIDDLVVDLGNVGATTRVRGTITVDGETMPANSLTDEPRGYLTFECLQVRSRTCSHAGHLVSYLSTEGVAEYDVELGPGSYRVVLHSGHESVVEVSNSNALPPGDYVLDPRLEVADEDMTRDFDMKLVRLSGELSVDGRALPPVESFSPYAENPPDEPYARRGPLEVYRPLDHPNVSPVRFEISESGPTPFAVDAFPGYHRVHLELGGLIGERVYRGAPGLTNWVAVASDTDISWDLPLHHAEVRLTHFGAPWPGEGFGYVEARTALGRYQTPVDADGKATVWWLGEDPTLLYYDAGYSGDLVMMLRKGCGDMSQ